MVPKELRSSVKYCDWKTRSESKVVHWRWGNWWMWSPEPFFFERHGFSRGRPMREPPNEPEEHQFAEGLDDNGRVVVMRQYTSIKRGRERWCYETFYEHTDVGVEWAQFDYSVPGKELLAHHRLSGPPDKPISHEWQAHYGKGRERFSYDKDRLTRIEGESFDDTPRSIQYHLEVVWDSGRRPVLIRYHEGGGSTCVVWRRPVKGQSIGRSLKEYEKILLDAIPDAIKRLGLHEPMSSLVLTYDCGNTTVPPSINVGLERERLKWIADKGEGSRDYIWNPAEFKNCCIPCPKLDTTAASEAGRMLEQLLTEQESEERGVGMLRRVCRKLAALDWVGIAPISKDFVAYAVDLELVDLEESLAYALGRSRFTRIKQAGLIP